MKKKRMIFHKKKPICDYSLVLLCWFDSYINKKKQNDELYDEFASIDTDSQSFFNV